MMEQLFLGVSLLGVGVVLIALGRNSGRNNNPSVKARIINNSTIIQGGVNISAAPAEQKPARGWMELTGWMATIGSFVVAVIALFKS